MSKVVFARGGLRIKTVRSVDEITDQLITALEHLDVDVQYEKEGTFRFQIPLVKIAIKYNNTRAYPLQGFSSGNIQVVAIRPDYLKIVYQLETEYTFLRSVLIPFLIISFLTSFLSLPLSDIFSTLPFWQIILMGFPLAMILFFALAYMNKKEGIRVFQIFIENSLIRKLYDPWPRTEFYAADKSFTLLMMIFGISAYVCVINPLVQKLYTAYSG